MNRLLAICISIVALCCTSTRVLAGDEKSGGSDPGGGGGNILGRCCFLGIVADPILCEVSTEQECYFNTVPISWTAGLTCDTPCESHDDCGTLVMGVECTLFASDSGGLFILSNLGSFTIGDRVRVTGAVDPNCVSFCQQGNGCIVNNTIEACGDVTGACCNDMLGNPLGCFVTTQTQCQESGGIYIGDNTSCTNPSNPCTVQLGRCCFLGIIADPPICEVTTLAVCQSQTNFVSWTPGVNCDNLCTGDVSGACCVPFNIPGAAHCIQATADQCEAVGGDYHGDGTSCNSIGVCPPLGRCCFVGIIFPPFLCDVTTQEECSGYPGGTWIQGLTCDTPCTDTPTGACCFFDNPGTLNCFVATAAECQELGGEYQGNGTNCGPTGFCEPPVTGACCLLTPIPEGVCIQVTAEQCQAQNGNYQGDGVQCPTNGTCMFEIGACCIDVDDGPLQYDSCIFVSPAQCALQGGVYQGPFTHCIVAACCLPDGSCQDADPRCCAASGGTPRNTPCATAPCISGQTGACCLITDIPEGECIETSAAECEELNGNYLGDGTICTPGGNPCFGGPQGACCIPQPNSPMPTCQVLTQSACSLAGGTYLGNGTACPPPGAVCSTTPTGACCRDIDDGPLQYDTCSVMTSAQCQQVGGVFQGLNTHCILTACCLPDGSCQDADPRCCAASGGTPRNAPCAFTSCANDPIGACCLVTNVPGASNCVNVTEAQCNQFGGQFHGEGTNCNSADLCPPLGRCCFVGIVADPILCDVNTQAECQAYAGFISWTANLTCDAPCEPTGGDDFAGCGTLGPGPQGCVLLHADTGQTFALENVGPVIGSRVFVRGTIEPHSFLCFPIIFRALLNNTIGVCFNDCGELVNGVECILFQSDSGGLYVVQNLGNFTVGDRVRVRGGLNPVCVTICQQGDGCIEDNTIEPCPNAPPTGACCNALPGTPGNCFVTTALQCTQVNGQYQGDGTVCSPAFVCPNPLGRCCFLGFNGQAPICQMLTQSACMNLPAPISWDANLTCATPCNVQPPTGACCNTPVANPLGCIVVTQAQCGQLGGDYAGDGTTCWPVNPCNSQFGRCCFLGFNPQTPLCEVTTFAQCYNFPAVISWTPGLTCDVPCELPCDAGDANGDGAVDGRDIDGFVRSLLGSPAAGDHPDCCNFNSPTLGDQVQAFVATLQS